MDLSKLAGDTTTPLSIEPAGLALALEGLCDGVAKKDSNSLAPIAERLEGSASALCRHERRRERLRPSSALLAEEKIDHDEQEIDAYLHKSMV